MSNYVSILIFMLVYLPHHFFLWKCCHGDFLEPSISLVKGLCVWHGNNLNSGHLWIVQSLPLLLSAYHQPCTHSKDALSLSPNLHSVVNSAWSRQNHIWRGFSYLICYEVKLGNWKTGNCWGPNQGPGPNWRAIYWKQGYVEALYKLLATFPGRVGMRV